MPLPDAIIDSVGNKAQFSKFNIITLSHSGVLTAYQKLITVTWKSQMQNDFADISFATLSGGWIPHWIESKTDGVTAEVWIKYDGVDGNTDIRMYYGNPSLSSGSSGVDTFVAWHGAETTDFKDSNAFQIPLIYESRFRRTSASTSHLFWGFSDVAMHPITGDAGVLMSHSTGVYLKVHNDGTESFIKEGVELTNNQWYKGKIVVSSSSDAHGFFDGNEVASGISTNIPVGVDMGLGMNIFVGTGEQEYSFIRQYTAIDPTYETSEGHYNRNMAQFM